MPALTLANCSLVLKPWYPSLNSLILTLLLKVSFHGFFLVACVLSEEELVGEETDEEEEVAVLVCTCPFGLRVRFDRISNLFLILVSGVDVG